MSSTGGGWSPIASLKKLFSRHVGAMLVRNTAVSTGAFLLGLGLLWLLVQKGGMNEVLAAGISFLVVQTLHYILGRVWIFRGTDRDVASGYALFLVNAGLGLAITVSLFALILRFTAIHYLAARVLVSVFAGLAMFVSNATINFRKV